FSIQLGFVGIVIGKRGVDLGHGEVGKFLLQLFRRQSGCAFGERNLDDFGGGVLNPGYAFLVEDDTGGDCCCQSLCPQTSMSHMTSPPSTSGRGRWRRSRICMCGTMPRRW